MKSVRSLLVLSVLTGMTYANAATLTLSGTVASNCVLNQVTPTSYTTLNIAAGETVTVAQTDVTCNHAPGFKLRASSANNGVLTNGSAPNNTTPYTMKIFGTGTLNHIALTTAPQDLVNTGTLAAPVTNEMRNIEVTVTAAATPWAGTYSDTVTITLTTL